MIPKDQLTRAERIRLECFAQVTGRHQMHPMHLKDALTEAEQIEHWLYQAREHELSALALGKIARTL